MHHLTPGFTKMFVTLFLTALGTIAYSQSTQLYEKDYADYIQSLIGGEREVQLQDGRADLVTDEYAIEIEWAPKWKEAIGQALWYALNTTKKPAIILILENQDQYKYLIQLNSALDFGNLSETIQVLAFPNDFQDLMEE